MNVPKLQALTVPLPGKLALRAADLALRGARRLSHCLGELLQSLAIECRDRLPALGKDLSNPDLVRVLRQRLN